MSTAGLALARTFLSTGTPAHEFELLDDQGRALKTSAGASMLRIGKRAGLKTLRIRVAVEDLASLTDVLPPKGLAYVAGCIQARVEGRRR